jgi:hypothetical protein
LNVSFIRIEADSVGGVATCTSASPSNIGIIGNPFFPIAGNNAAVSATPVGPPTTRNKIEIASDKIFSPVSSISAYVASSAGSRGGNSGEGG